MFIWNAWIIIIRIKYWLSPGIAGKKRLFSDEFERMVTYKMEWQNFPSYPKIDKIAYILVAILIWLK